MRTLKITSIIIAVVFLITAVWAGDRYYDKYMDKLRYNFKYNYMVHRNNIHHYNRKIKRNGRTVKTIPTREFKLGWNPLPSEEEVGRRVKLFRPLPMYLKKNVDPYEEYRLGRKWSVIKLFA